MKLLPIWRTCSGARGAAAAAQHLQAGEAVLAGLGQTEQVARHGRRADHGAELVVVDQAGGLLHIPAVHGDQPALGAEAGQVAGMQAGDMEQRHRQQCARLHGRRRRHDAGHLLADEAVQFPRQQRTDDVAVAAEHTLGWPVEPEV